MEKGDRINQEQFFDIITGEDLSWQSIIYDLIRTEQLDPWDIDLGILAKRYLERISVLEESNFHVSSKVLLACSLLLRLKSEILINSFIPELDLILYGGGEERRYEVERIEIDESELPILVPRTPMARHRKVTLEELMSALGKAINTETRRIKKEIKGIQAKKSALMVLPSKGHIPLRVRVKSILGIVKNHMAAGNGYIKFSHLAPEREERLACFVPILHLSNSKKIYLRQKEHFDDIHIALKMHEEEFQEMETELQRATQES